MCSSSTKPKIKCFSSNFHLIFSPFIIIYYLSNTMYVREKLIIIVVFVR